MNKTTQSPPQSFEKFYKHFALPLMKFLVKRMGGNQIAAEEVFSQTMAAAWRSWSKFEHKSTFFTWVCRIGLNKMADYYREQVHHNSVLIAPTLEQISNIKSHDLTPEEKFALMELRVAVRECLNSLPEEQKRLLYLRFWKDRTIKAIAKGTGKSERSVEGKIYRAKLSLKTAIKQRHPNLIPDKY